MENQYYFLSPYGDTYISVWASNGAESTVYLPQGQVVTFDAGSDTQASGLVRSSRPILVSHKTNSNQYAYPVPPVSTELWGIRSNDLVIGALEKHTHVWVYGSDGQDNAESPYELQVGQKIESTVVSAGSQGTGAAVHLIADRPIAAIQAADGDGDETTGLWPTENLATHYAIPLDAQYIAIACPSTTTITLSTATSRETQVCTANGNYPGKAYFGSAQNGVHIAAGATIESIEPIFLIYETSGTNDEHNLLGANLVPRNPDTTAPASIDPNGVTVTLDNGQVTLSAPAGSAEGNIMLIITNLDTGDEIQITTNPDGSLTATLPGADGQVLSMQPIDAAGNRGSATSIGIGTILSLNTQSPANGATVTTDSILVTGEFIGPPNSSVIVNGVIACIQDGHFYANDVPLQLGENILEVTATMADGVRQTQSMHVTSAGTAPFRIHVDPLCGVAPRTVSVSVEDRTDSGISLINVDFDSDGTVDFSTNDPQAEISYTYTTPGLQTASVSVADWFNPFYTEQKAIVIESFTQKDQRLRGIYTKMIDRLRVGSKLGALKQVTGGVYEKYEEVFTVLGTDLSTVADQLGTLETSAVGPQMAEYYVRRTVDGANKVFPIYLIQSEDGVWRIDGM